MKEENNGKNSGKSKVIVIIPGIVAAAIVMAVMLLFVVPLKQVTNRITIELGDAISTDLDDYVSGFKPGFWVTKLDVTDVNTGKVGNYTVKAEHGFQDFTYEVFVVDTTAPVLTLISEKVYLKEGEMYPVSYFVEDTFDLSGDVTVTVSDVTMPDYRRGYVYSENSGQYTLTFYAKDASANESVYTLVVTVDTPPTITGMKNYYVIPGTTLNYLEFIEASDIVDGDVSAGVYTNAGDVDLSSVGEYKLTYICEDSYGLSSEETVRVNVMESMDIQNLINIHEINRFDEIIVGAYNLYDIGYYDDKSINEMLDIMRPTTVRIVTKAQSYGSGFIVDITDEEIVVATSQHVVGNYETVDVYFFDGTKMTGTIAGKTYDYDLGFVSVKREDVSDELLNKLYTVHINRGYWDELGNEADLQVGVRCITDKGTVWRDKTGKMVYKSGTTDLMWRSVPKVMRITANLFHGASGSNVFDIHGNSMGVATYIITGGGRYETYCVTLETLCDQYEELFGRKLYYY